MKHPHLIRPSMRTILTASLAFLTLFASFSGLDPTIGATHAGSAQEPDPEFDRLDGKGKSRRRVDVVEWEGNLEIHVYPGGSLRGLALKLDDRDQARKVMVIGYRFDTQPNQQLIRRALLSIPMSAGFQVYRDPSSGEEYDKVIVTQHSLGKPLVTYKTEPEPTQLYPEGHPMNAEPKKEAYAREAKQQASEVRAPASQGAQVIIPNADDDDGSIRPFHW
jgi:hypothetical protein